MYNMKEINNQRLWLYVTYRGPGRRLPPPRVRGAWEALRTFANVFGRNIGATLKKKESQS